MATFYGRVNKRDYSHTGLFAGIVPVYMRGMNTGNPEVVEANWCPVWFFDVVEFLVMHLPLPYEGFMFTNVKSIK